MNIYLKKLWVFNCYYQFCTNYDNDMNIKNEGALRSFEAGKSFKVDNGSVRKYDADVIYENHKTGNVYQLGDVELCSEIEYGYGGKKLTIDDLTDKSDVFSQISTNFGTWSCINGVLEVKGKDNTGRKGDYTLTLK